MHKGVLYCTLPYNNGDATITCVDLTQNGSERQFDFGHVQQLIPQHNRSNDNELHDL